MTKILKSTDLEYFQQKGYLRIPEAFSPSEALTSMGEQKLITVGQAKKILGCSAQSIRRFIKDGLLEGSKTETGRWIVSENSVSELVNQKKTQHKTKSDLPTFFLALKFQNGVGGRSPFLLIDQQFFIIIF